MNELVMNGAIRITRPTENAIKVEVLDNRGQVIYELPIAMLAKGDSFTIEPITVSIAPLDDPDEREPRKTILAAALAWMNDRRAGIGKAENGG